MITQVRHLQEELSRFNPDAIITDESGSKESIELSFRSPATMCGFRFGTESTKDAEIKELQESLDETEKRKNQKHLALEEIQNLMLYGEGSDPEIDTKILAILSEQL